MAKPTVADQERELKAQLAELARTRRPREVAEALDKGFLPQGVRLANPKGGEDGVPLTFTPKEAATLVEPLRKIIVGRLAAAAKTPAASLLLIGIVAALAWVLGFSSDGSSALALATVQLSVAVRNGMLDAIETTVGTAAVLKFRTGAQPANCAAADSGTVVASITLASDWMAAASSGSKSFSGTPLTDASADNAGTIGHYRVYASDGTTCHEQGSVTVTGGGGDLTVDNNVLTAGQSFSVTSWSQNMNGHA